jgi:plastocyanin
MAGAGAKPSRQQFTLLAPALTGAAMQAQQFPEMNADSPRARALLPRRIACALVALAAALPGVQAAPLSVRVTDAQGLPLADAAVSVFPAGTAAAAAPGVRAEMAQKGRAFVPAVLVVQTGTAVSFPNQDKVRHHVYSFSPVKPFELKLYGGEVAPAVVFNQPGTVVLGCNIHDLMLAYVHVVDTPYFARTGEQGLARLDVPAGTHRLQVWHPALGESPVLPPRSVQVLGGGSELTVQLGVKAGASR